MRRGGSRNGPSCRLAVARTFGRRRAAAARRYRRGARARSGSRPRRSRSARPAGPTNRWTCLTQLCAGATTPIGLPRPRPATVSYETLDLQRLQIGRRLDDRRLDLVSRPLPNRYSSAASAIHRTRTRASVALPSTTLIAEPRAARCERSASTALPTRSSIVCGMKPVQQQDRPDRLILGQAMQQRRPALERRRSIPAMRANASA